MATTLGSSLTMLRDMAAPSVVKIAENGTLAEFYVAKHDYESGLNGAGRTLLVRKSLYGSAAFNSNGTNAYANGGADTYLNGTYKGRLEADIQAAVGSTTFYYTPGNGNNTRTTLSRSVFLLSAYEWGQTSNSGRRYNHEGTPIGTVSYASSTPYWTRTPNTGGTNRAIFINYVNSSSYADNGSCTTGFSLRPAFTLPSTALVDANGKVFIDNAPTLTGNITDGADLGVKTEGFDLTYTIEDADGDAVTVKEYLDGIVQRTYTAALGTSNTFQAVSAANFQRVLNGSHTIKIEATDGYFTTTLTAAFEKRVTEAVITLKEPLAVEGDISVAVLVVTAELPKDAVYKVEATNNANDAAPVWQDVTTEVKLGQNILFKNSVCKNGAAFNFRITAGRGSSDTAGNISVISGAFQ